MGVAFVQIWMSTAGRSTQLSRTIRLGCWRFQSDLLSLNLRLAERVSLAGDNATHTVLNRRKVLLAFTRIHRLTCAHLSGNGAQISQFVAPGPGRRWPPDGRE